MSFSIYSIPLFDKQAKRLSKKYPSLKSDLAVLIESLSAWKGPVGPIHFEEQDTAPLDKLV